MHARKIIIALGNAQSDDDANICLYADLSEVFFCLLTCHSSHEL